MGYETRMYICEHADIRMEEFIRVTDGELKGTFHLFSEDTGPFDKYFYHDGNTKTYVKSLTDVGYERFQASWGSIIAMIDMSKCSVGEFGELISISHNSVKSLEKGMARGHFYCPGDGNKTIAYDMYDDPMYFVNAKEVLEALKVVVKNDDYRRFKIALSTLKETMKHFPPEYLKVLFYGY